MHIQIKNHKLLLKANQGALEYRQKANLKSFKKGNWFVRRSFLSSHFSNELIRHHGLSFEDFRVNSYKQPVDHITQILRSRGYFFHA